ncbi:hypothetical protein PQR72_41860 [Paraburkholderia madseniana]|nr:hypothetical protein [Paraburkholderia madseniana]
MIHVWLSVRVIEHGGDHPVHQHGQRNGRLLRKLDLYRSSAVRG